MLSFMTRASTATTFTLSLHDALPISREAEEISAAFFSGDLGQLTERQLVQACQGMPTTVLTEAELRSLSIVERSEEHTSELQSLTNLVCRLLLEKKKIIFRDLSG